MIVELINILDKFVDMEVEEREGILESLLVSMISSININKV